MLGSKIPMTIGLSDYKHTRLSIISDTGANICIIVVIHKRGRDKVGHIETEISKYAYP